MQCYKSPVYAAYPQVFRKVVLELIATLPEASARARSIRVIGQKRTVSSFCT